MAKLKGEDKEYFKKLERTGWTKRRIDSGQDFSVVKPGSSDIKVKIYFSHTNNFRNKARRI